jgi:hypothetical protein
MRLMQDSTRLNHGLGFLAALSALAWAALSLSACDTADAGTDKVDSSQIVLLAPKGGEKVKVGDTLRIKWKTQGLGITEITSVDIKFSHDNGVRWTTFRSTSIRPEDVAIWGNYPWVVRDSMSYPSVGNVYVLGDQCLIKVEKYTPTDPKEISISKPFTISPK